MEDAYDKARRRKRLATFIILCIAGVYLGGSYLYEEYQAKKVIGQAQFEKINRLNRIIDNPNESDYLRFATKNEIIILQPISWSTDSIEFLMGNPLIPKVHPFNNLKKIEYHNAVSSLLKTVNVAKSDLKEALCDFETEESGILKKCKQINAITTAEPVLLYDGITFNGIDFQSKGYRFARKGKPANLSVKNSGLPIIINSLKAVKGTASLDNQNLPASIPADGYLKITIEPEGKGNSQSYEFDLNVSNQSGEPFVYKFKGKGKNRTIEEVMN